MGRARVAPRPILWVDWSCTRGPDGARAGETWHACPYDTDRIVDSHKPVSTFAPKHTRGRLTPVLATRYPR
jgi:hypothetical protein